MTRAEIQLIKSLEQKRSRHQSGLFIAEGEKLISEILDSRLTVRKIFALDGLFAGESCCEAISRKEMERITHLTSASNSLALVEIPDYRLSLPSLGGGVSLMLDGVQNPGNLGTIIRLADWFGIEQIICSPHCADCFSPKVVQATMGAILRIKVHYAPLVELLEQIQELNIPIIGTALEGENLYSAKLPESAIIVMGNEGRGISDEVRERLSSSLYIPPYPAENPSSESLNVAIATAIICAEFRRRI